MVSAFPSLLKGEDRSVLNDHPCSWKYSAGGTCSGFIFPARPLSKYVLLGDKQCKISVYFGQICIYFQIPGLSQYINLGGQRTGRTTLQPVGWNTPQTNFPDNNRLRKNPVFMPPQLPVRTLIFAPCSGRKRKRTLIFPTAF